MAKLNNIATMEKFEQLNNLIEAEDVSGIKAFFEQVIDEEYGAGHQEAHKRSLAKLMNQYEFGMWNKETKKRWAINEMVKFYGNVANRTLI